MTLYTFTIERRQDGRGWRPVATWERFGTGDWQQALDLCVKAAELEYPDGTLRVRIASQKTPPDVAVDVHPCDLGRRRL